MTYRPGLFATVSQQALAAFTPQALATLASAAAARANASATNAQNALAALQAKGAQSTSSSGASSLYGAPTLPGVVIDINPQLPASTSALVAGTAGFQVDGSGYVQAMNDGGPYALAASKGYGTGNGGGGAQLVASTDLQGSPKILRGVLNNYDNLVFSPSVGDYFYKAPAQPWCFAALLKTTAQGGNDFIKAQTTSGVNLTVNHYGVSSGSGLVVGQNNGNEATEPAGLPINQWDIVFGGYDGQYYWVFRNGTLTAQSVQITNGGGFGANCLSVFELLNGYPGDMARFVMANQFPSIAQMQAQQDAWVSAYGITTSMAKITAGDGAAAQYTYDAAADWLTTPNFPTANPPAVASAGLTGLTLASGSTNLVCLRFGGVSGANVPDRATLDKYFFYNPIFGNQNNVTGNDGVEGVNTCYARARHYAPTNPYDLHVLKADGLHMGAVGSKNNTTWTPGGVYGAFARLGINLLPGMTVKVRYKTPTDNLAWLSLWLSKGHQVSPNQVPGSGGSPYFGYGTSGQLIQDTPYYEEFDINDGFTRSNLGVAMGHQIDFGVVIKQGNGGKNGNEDQSPNETAAPYTSYVANGNGVAYQANNGYPFASLTNFSTNDGIHEAVLNWRGDGSHLIDYFIDGHLIATQYKEFYTTTLSSPMPDGTTQIGLHLILSNQAIPNFAPGVTGAQITVPDRTTFEGVIEEISVFQGNVANPTAGAAPNALSAPLPVLF